MKVLIATALLCSLFACGKDDDDKDEVVSTAVASAYEGTWKIACIEVEPGEGVYFSVTDVYTLNVLKRTTSLSQNADCSSPLSTDLTTYTFVVGAAISTDTNKIDLTQTSLTQTLTTQQTVTNANSNQSYGYSNWAINVPKDIAGKGIDADDDEPQYANGAKTYTIIKLANGKLTYGLGEGETEASRPTTTDETKALTK